MLLVHLTTLNQGNAPFKAPSDWPQHIWLSIGTPIQQLHQYCCGGVGDRLGHHNLSCWRDTECLPHDASLKDVLYQALSAASVVAVLNQGASVDCGDRHQPDNITISLFCQGRMLVWDASYVNTFSNFHLLECATQAVEDCRHHRYTALSQRYDFVPVTKNQRRPGRGLL